MASCSLLSADLSRMSLNSDSSDYLDVLSIIKKNYESIFCWDVYEKTHNTRDKLTTILEKVTKKVELMFEDEKTFNLDRLCMNLICCFETFLNGEFVQALSGINDIIHTLNEIEMDEFFKPISDACFHIVHTSQAYIMAFLEKDVKEVLKNIKPSSNFNKVERSAVCAIKSIVFLEYPPGGNQIALELVECARSLNYTEVKWISIWLKAKGRKRRFDRALNLPSREELEAANKLSSYENAYLLLRASDVYKDAGFILKISNLRANISESNNYYKLSIDLTLKVYKIAENDSRLLYKCLEVFINLPRHLVHNHISVIENIVYKLNQVQNKRIDDILGKYYLKIAKNYKKAKTHLESASSGGLFSSSLQLLKVECLLESVDQFPVVRYLNSLYELFPCAKRRLIIVSQILLYYIFNEKNPEQLLHYLNVYFNEDTDYVQKKRHIEATFPLFQLKARFNPKNFLNVVSDEIRKLQMLPHWSSKNKDILENVVKKFAATCNPEKTEESTEKDLTCVICLENVMARVVLRPCHHQCVCKTCWSVLEKKQPTCPLCRTVVISVLIY